jgi:hypothetical protein
MNALRMDSLDALLGCGDSLSGWFHLNTLWQITTVLATV